MFHPLFDAADPVIQVLASDYKTPDIEPLHASPWVAMSALQKSIRRGDVGLASRAAATLLMADQAKLWRRVAGIAFEDIGLADLECVKLVIAATAGRAFRRDFGGEHRVAGLVVARMCEAKKCRAADDLFIAVSHGYRLDALRNDLAREDLQQHLSHVRERRALLGASLAALHASGTRWAGQVAGKGSDPKALFAAMRSAGIDHEIVELAEQGFRRTREALPVLLPLLNFVLPSGDLRTACDEFPKVVVGCSGIPTYCLDGFSYEGRAALSRFMKRNTATGRWFRKYVDAERRLSVLAGAVFRVEGGLVRQRVQWPCAATLRHLADAGYHGMQLARPSAFLEMVRADLPVLDEVRANVR